MMNFKTIQTRLSIGLGLMVILVILISSLSLWFVKNLEVQLNELSDSVVPTIETTDDLISNLWESAKVANEILAAEEIDELQRRSAEIEELAEAYTATDEELRALVTSPEYIASIDAAKAEQAQFLVRTKAMAAERLIELQKETIAENLLDEFDKTGSVLITMLDEFATENEDEMRKAEDQGDVLAARGAPSSMINDVLGELFEKDYPVVEAALKLQRLIIEMQDTSGEYLAEESITNLPAIQEEFQALANRSGGYMKILTDLAETEEDAEDARVLKSTFNAWFSGADDEDALFDSYRDLLIAEEKADELTELLEINADKADAALEEVATAADSISDSADEKAQEVVSGAIYGIVSLMGIAIVIGVLVLLMCYKTVLKPINALLDRMTDIAEGEGDLTRRADVNSDDELGKTAAAFNLFVEKVQTLVTKMAKSTDEVVLSSERQKELSASAKDGIVQQNQETDSVAAAINEMTTTAEHVADSAKNTSEATDEAGKETQTAKNVVHQSINSVQELAGDIDNASKVITSLAHDVENISQVLEVIRGVAEQTNLLALNAAIEAARAGEQGRGFAVVADEVRSLAGRTQDSTEQISQMIEALQKGSRSAVEAMERSKVNGERSVSHSQNAGESLNKVAELMTKINGMNEQIALSSDEQNKTMNELLSNVNSIVSISQNSMVEAEENDRVSNELGKLGGELKSVVNQFKY